MKIAILGTGLAAKIHSNTLKAVAPAVERWYASRDAQRAEAARTTFGGAGSIAGYDAAFARADLDAVVVAVPPVRHLDLTLAALAAGKHVVLEKPPFLHADDFARVGTAAQAAGRQVLVAENYFYKPLTRLLRESIAAGHLGDLKFITLNALKRQTTNDWRDDAAVSGAGALFEGGIHWVCLLASLGLTPARIRAARVDRAGPLDRSVLVTLEYAEGAAAALTYSWDVPGLVNGVRWSACYGTAGVLRFETNGLLAIQSGRRRRIIVPGVRDLLGYRAMWADFLAAMRDNRAPAYTLALAERDLRLVERAYSSLELTD